MSNKKPSKTIPLDLQPNGGYAILGSWANAYLAKPSKTLATGREKQMASQIETFADGSESFFSNRVPAWHALGTVTENALSASDDGTRAIMARNC